MIMAERETIDSFKILGARIHPISVEKLNSFIAKNILVHQKTIIANVNVHALNIAFITPWFRDFLNNSPIVFCDGFGVIFGARILGFKIPERITYADWIWQLAEFSSIRNFTFYFLGSKDGIAEKAAFRLLERFPELKINGIGNGYFDKTPGSLENEKVIERINKIKPDVLIIGFGMPLQERWLLDNWDRIDAKIALTGGAVFDYISGELQRGPKFLTNHGFEWLARLLIEPRRLWKRYLIGNPIFMWRIFKQKLGILKQIQ